MMRRREFIAGLGGAAAWPLVARAQQGDRVRRIGVLIGGDGNDPVYKGIPSALTQGLEDLGWTDGRNTLRSRKRLRTWGGPILVTCGWTFGGPAVTSIGYERSRRSWSACDPTSS